MPAAQPIVLDRYALYAEIASGGMAAVHLGRRLGPAGFSRTVAIKRMHPQCAKEPEFVAMFVDEARLAARVQHANVVQTLDVVSNDGELFLVMEYVAGESLGRLIREAQRRGERLPPRVAAAIVVGTLHGLHAAHEAKTEHGEPLGLVHRDVSPPNVLVGSDGIPRVVDFGVAKAIGRLAATTREGNVKGKVAYMAPEQLGGASVDRRTDVFAAGVVLWEALTGQSLFAGATEGETLLRILSSVVAPPSSVAPDVPEALDAVVHRAVERDPELRFATAREMAAAIEAAIEPASWSEVGEWVERLAATALADRAAMVASMERGEPPEPDEEATATEVSPAPRPAPHRRRVPLVALGALGASALAVGGLAVARRNEPVPVASAAAPPSAAPVVSAEPAPSETAAVVPSSSASAAPSSAPARARAAPRPPTPSRCDPPWYVDSAGVKRWKSACR